jgi:hypothetical protein
MLCFLFNQIREHESRTGSAKKWEVEGCLAQIMYTYISKCKNDKIKERKKNLHHARTCARVFVSHSLVMLNNQY